MAYSITVKEVLETHDDFSCRESLNDALKFFCNNVFLGQWELAKTAIPSIRKLQGDQPTSHLDIVDALIKICQYPFPQSLGSKTVPTPHHLSWLSFQQLKSLSLSDQKESQMNSIGKEIDFRMTLLYLGDIEQDVLEELFLCFQKHVNGQSISQLEDAGSEFLSEKCLSVIKSTILRCPSLGHSVISALMVDRGLTENREGEMLQGLFIDCMLSLLDKLETTQEEIFGKKGPDDILDKLLEILSFYDPVPYWNYLQLRKLFLRLVTLAMTQEEDTGQTLIEEIVSLISGRLNSYLLDEFTKVYFEVSDRSSFKKLSPELIALTEKQKFHLKLLTLVDRYTCWRDFFIHCYKQRSHFLAEILDLSLSLVKAEQFMELQDLLSFPEFHPLKAVVLLMGWSSCRSASHARNLLENLWQDKIENPNALLAASCRKLAYNLDLIQWCLERASPLLEVSQSNPNRHASELLQSLETHSVLYMLHHSANLASLDEQEVLHLLNNISTDKKKAEGKKSVTFQDEGKGKVKEPVNVEQQKDIAVFKSYCAIKNMMEAIMFCVDNFEHRLLNPVQVKRTVRVKSLYRSFSEGPSSSEGEDSSSPTFNQDVENKKQMHGDQKEDPESFPNKYKDCVTAKLSKVKEYLSTLQPLSYRLEIMEDIYSLLFLTHEDLSDNGDGPEVDSDQDDDSKHSGIMNSLNASIASEEDPMDEKPKLSPKKLEKLSSNPSSDAPPSPTNIDYDVPFVDPKQEGVSHSRKEGAESFFSTQKELYHNNEPKLANLDKIRPLKIKCKIRNISISSDLDFSNSPVGYLLSDYPVRDILHILKESVGDLNAARYTLISLKKEGSQLMKTPPSKLIRLDVEDALQDCGLSTFKEESFSRRLSKLTQAIHEAWWRFQLVSHAAIPKQPGYILRNPVVVSENDVSFLLTEVQLFPPQNDPNLLSPDTSTRQKHHRGFFSRNIICRMMAPPESLLVFSLIKNQLSQAAEVIKLFHINEKSPEACEVAFAELFVTKAETVWELEKDTKEPTSAPKKVGKRNVKALAKAASVGVASASLSNIVDEIVTAPSLPSVPKLKSGGARKAFSFLFNIDSVSAVLLDLLFTSCRTLETCSTMLDIIKTRTKLLDNEEELKAATDVQEFDWNRSSVSPSTSTPNTEVKLTSKTVHSGIKGHMGLLWSAVDLISQSGIENGSTLWPQLDMVIPYLSKTNLQHHLHTACSSLQVSCHNQLDRALAETRKSVDKVLQIMSGNVRPDQFDISLEDASSRSTSPRGSLSGSFIGTLPVPRKISKSGDQSPLHAAFRQLIHTMERGVPGDGLLQLLLSKTNKANSPPLRNFLLSLYEHVKEMANLVAECEGKNKDLINNFFKIMEDGPVSILGRLMFVKKMPPARLEPVAEKLSLNLNHTIVHSCCPKIPCKHPEYFTRHTGQGIEVSASEEDIHPEELVRSTLTSLHNLMESIAIKQNAKGIFDNACSAIIIDMKEYNEVMKNTALLKEVDLSKLQSNEERICFYANLTNLMVIHTHLTHVEIRKEMMACEGKEDSKNDNSEEPPDDLCPFTALDSLAFFSVLSYSVGQLGQVNAFDLCNIICRPGLKPPSKWNDLLTSFKLVLQPGDPWLQYGPPTEPRLLFVLNTGCEASPPLQILHPNTVMSQLDKSMLEFLSHTVTISMNDEKVWIPEILTWYEQDFVSEKEYATNNRHAALIRWISNHVNETKQQQMQDLFQLDSVHGFSENIDMCGKYELPFRVEVDSFISRFSIAFDVSHVYVDGGSKTSVSTPVDSNRQQTFRWSNSIELSGHGVSLKLPVYNLTPATLEYVKHDSLLVATMVSLVCADNLDNIEQHFSADHFNMPGETPRSGNESLVRLDSCTSDISLVDIRSYRYHRLTDDYPILQRHLLHYMLPLAGADNPELLETREPILKFVTNEIDDQVKLCMFSLPTSEQHQRVIQDMTNRLVEDRKWVQVMTILKSLPEYVLKERKELQAMHDFVLACWAIEQVDKPGQGPKVGDSLRKFYNADFQARTVMSLHDHLPLDLSIDVIQCSMALLDPSKGLWKALDSIYKQALLYQKIREAMEQLRIKLSLQDFPTSTWSADDQNLYKILDNFADWRRMAKVASNHHDQIILILEKACKFETAIEWAEKNKLSQDIIKKIKHAHLFHLLMLDEPDTVQAFQLLDGIRLLSEKGCLTMCQEVAQKLSNPREIKFLLNYIIEYLTEHLIAEELEDVRLQRIGAKALMCLPPAMRGEYNHLISCPHLIMEQLIMNMKAELAGQVFDEVKHDFVDVKEPKLKMAQEQFNELLVTYSKKALEVNVVVVQDQSRRDSVTSLNSGHFEECEFLASTRRAIDRKRVEMSVSPTLSSNSNVSGRQERASSKSNVQLRRPSRFIMPSQPPSRDQWMPDNITSVCTVCKVEQFSMFNRRHHCRRCGRVVCAACSTKQTLVFGVMSRTCDDCYEQITSIGEMGSEEEHEIYSQRIKERLSGNMGGVVSPLKGSPIANQEVYDSSVTGRNHGHKLTMNDAIYHVDHIWKLHSSVAETAEVRSEFYYEQSPSVTLCISILKQHNSRLEAGKLLLNLCDMLSSHLVPVSPGVPNPEIDYSLIISTMRQLLFQAKFDFLQSADSGMIGQCDMYLTRVDLLRTMAEASYKDLPTIKELTKPDLVRRLRDKLIADERLSLAMEVSTKCGLDPAGVWSAMGYACLQVGNFQGARDKFSHCLKVPSDKNQTALSQSRILGELLTFLDRMPSSGLTEIQMLMNNPRSICDINTLLVPSVGEENRVDSVPYQECKFYLRTFGSFTDQITFLLKHGYWMKAVQFTLDHHCSSDVFVNAVMKPALESGELGRLLEQMLMLDPTLGKWTTYLTAMCRHLLKIKYFHTLYQVQLFMKDFIRAAMTCISHFYQRGARDYLDLCGRLHYLFTAQQHLQAYLDPGQWGSVPHPLVPVTPPIHHPPHSSIRPPHWGSTTAAESTPRMTLTPDKVKGHIRLVALQIEVTRFLEQCLTQSALNTTDLPSTLGPKGASGSSSQIPTLFGQMTARTELVCTILLSGDDFGTSFKLAVRIIKECGLNTTVIFTHCSREMATQGRCSEIGSLIQALFRDGLVTDEGIDEIVGASLLVIADSQHQAKDESDSLIQLLRNDNNKINAYILCGKLRSAYLLAVKKDSFDDVQRIAGAAQRLGQPAVKNICKKWLEQHKR